MATLKEIVNNEKFSNTMFHLYERWLDEKEYEYIKDYGKFLHKSLADQFPNDDYKLIATTKRPFGIKVEGNDGKRFHLFVKMKGRYAVMCAQREATGD